MIKLKLLIEEDLPFLLEIRNDISTRSNLEDSRVFTLDQCKKWFESLKDPWYIVMVEQQKVGYFRTKGKQIGCDIHPNYRNKGYGKAAYKLFLDNTNHATLWVFEDNFAKNLYIDLGFKFNGKEKIIRNRKYVEMIYRKQ